MNRLHVHQHHILLRLLLLLAVVLTACSSSDRRSGPTSDAAVNPDAGGAADAVRIFDGNAPSDSGDTIEAIDAALDSASVDATPPSEDSSARGLRSTLTMSCDGILQGRAIVNDNSSLGIAFTQSESPYTFMGSISFDFPAGFSGAVNNPEVVDHDNRTTLAVTDRFFQTYGNHCWRSGTEAQPGSAVIETWRPSEGIVSATFINFPVVDCGSFTSVCVVNGHIETTAEGVFE